MTASNAAVRFDRVSKRFGPLAVLDQVSFAIPKGTAFCLLGRSGTGKSVTLRHIIDEQSPLHGATPESLEACRALFVASVVGVETVIPAAVQTQQDYTWRDVRFGERFVEIYKEEREGRLIVDYGRLHDTEPVS